MALRLFKMLNVQQSVASLETSLTAEAIVKFLKESVPEKLGVQEASDVAAHGFARRIKNEVQQLRDILVAKASVADKLTNLVPVVCNTLHFASHHVISNSKPAASLLDEAVKEVIQEYCDITQTSLEVLQAVCLVPIVNEANESKEKALEVLKARSRVSTAVACSNNGRMILELLFVKDMFIVYDALVLLQLLHCGGVAVETAIGAMDVFSGGSPDELKLMTTESQTSLSDAGSKIEKSLLANPAALSLVIQLLQDEHESRGDGLQATALDTTADFVRNESLNFFVLVTANNEDIRNIVTFQTFIELMLDILQRERVGRVINDRTVTNSEHSSTGKLNVVSRRAFICLDNIMKSKHCRKYFREVDGLKTLCNLCQGLLVQQEAQHLLASLLDGEGDAAQKYLEIADEHHEGLQRSIGLLLRFVDVSNPPRSTSPTHTEADGSLAGKLPYTSSKEEAEELHANRSKIWGTSLPEAICWRLAANCTPHQPMNSENTSSMDPSSPTRFLQKAKVITMPPNVECILISLWASLCYSYPEGGEIMQRFCLMSEIAASFGFSPDASVSNMQVSTTPIFCLLQRFLFWATPAPVRWKLDGAIELVFSKDGGLASFVLSSLSPQLDTRYSTGAPYRDLPISFLEDSVCQKRIGSLSDMSIANSEKDDATLSHVTAFARLSQLQRDDEINPTFDLTSMGQALLRVRPTGRIVVHLLSVAQAQLSLQLEEVSTNGRQRENVPSPFAQSYQEVYSPLDETTITVHNRVNHPQIQPVSASDSDSNRAQGSRFASPSESVRDEYQRSLALSPVGSDPTRNVQLWTAVQILSHIIFHNPTLKQVISNVPVDIPDTAGPADKLIDRIMAFVQQAGRLIGECPFSQQKEGPEVTNSPPNREVSIEDEPCSFGTSLCAFLKLLSVLICDCPQNAGALLSCTASISTLLELSRADKRVHSLFPRRLDVQIVGLSSVILALVMQHSEASQENEMSKQNPRPDGDLRATSIGAIQSEVGFDYIQSSLERLFRSDLFLQGSHYPLAPMAFAASSLPIQLPLIARNDIPTTFRFYSPLFCHLLGSKQEMMKRHLAHDYVRGQCEAASQSATYRHNDHSRPDAQICGNDEKNGRGRQPVRAATVAGVKNIDAELAEPRHGNREKGAIMLGRSDNRSTAKNKTYEDPNSSYHSPTAMSATASSTNVAATRWLTDENEALRNEVTTLTDTCTSLSAQLRNERASFHSKIKDLETNLTTLAWAYENLDEKYQIADREVRLRAKAKQSLLEGDEQQRGCELEYELEVLKEEKRRLLGLLGLIVEKIPGEIDLDSLVGPLNCLHNHSS
eukprot:GHVN01001987.1.p1 GENE.GHVN01001987.1~~GHVN01001987.1.p1  ORF type:complete len:1320 (-),score=157.85 GHVN01001987.1:541-4500(-)